MAITDSIERERLASGAKSFTVKALERQKRTLEQNIQRIVEAAKKDEQNVTFEQLGIDKLFVDETHEFKNLFCPTKLQNLTGISTSASQKAMDMYLKCRYLDEVTGSRGIVFATGAPISNSITEMHTISIETIATNVVLEIIILFPPIFSAYIMLIPSSGSSFISSAEQISTYSPRMFKASE